MIVDSSASKRGNPGVIFVVIFLLLFSVLILKSIAPFLFPVYYLYIAVGLISYFIVSRVDFDIFAVFHKHFYLGSVLFLIIPLLIGQVTRGAIRWIPIGVLSFQPAEIIRPFLLIFFCVFFTENKKVLNTFLRSLGYLVLPVILILIQPSLGVALITTIGYAEL